MGGMKPFDCPKHDTQKEKGIQETWRPDGSRQFQIKCMVCGKLGEKRRTHYGAVKAWNAEALTSNKSGKGE